MKTKLKAGTKAFFDIESTDLQEQGYVNVVHMIMQCT